MDKRTQYVVGFLFNDVGDVALIEKNRPVWQKGKFNGIGGHIEKGETPVEAMKREFIEETGTSIDNWKQYCTVYYKDAVVHFFRAFGFYPIETKTDEWVFWQPLDNLGDNVIPSLHWLIPLALYNDNFMLKIDWRNTNE